VTLLIATGCWSLALGAISGWPLAILSQGGPRGSQWRFLREPKRLMQLHLDWIMMGTLLVAIGVAVPDLPGWASWSLVAGGVANPLLFVPLALAGSHVRQRRDYRAVAVVSFAALSIGVLTAATVAST
jgi:hypothetical protein